MELVAEEEEAAAPRPEPGTLAPPAFSGATFTVWNAGEHDVSQAAIPVVPPQAAALVAGTAALTVVCDHRILHAAPPAAAFLSTPRSGVRRRQD